MNYKNFDSDDFPRKVGFTEADLTDRQKIFNIVKEI